MDPRLHHSRTAFGRSIQSFQNSRFDLSEVETELGVTRAYVDKCALALDEGHLGGEGRHVGDPLPLRR